MIIRARRVVTMDGAPLENGAVEVRGNRILAVGSWNELRLASAATEVIDLGECVLLPGLLNAHCHLDYTGLRGCIPRPDSFTAWIRAINERKAVLTPDDYVQSIESGFAEAANFGTTTLANFAAFPELVERIRPRAMRTWWFAEMLDLRAPISAAAVLQAVRRTLDPLAHAGLAPHAPFTASADLYAEAAEFECPLSTHLAESREEMQMFRDASGPLFDFLRQIGRPMDDCGNTTPLALLAERGQLDERWIVAHLNELTGADFRLLEKLPRFHIVHCPRSHAYFGHTPFSLTELSTRGFNICVGTDSLASNDDLSLLAELRQLRRTQPSLSPRALLETITVNPAAALRQADTLGRIRSGFLADLVALPCESSAPSVLENLIGHEGKVSWRMVDGIVRP